MFGPVYLTEDIRRIEQAAGKAEPPLMERAGAAAAALAARLAAVTAVNRRSKAKKRFARNATLPI